jgi:hypothetical protein
MLQVFHSTLSEYEDIIQIYQHKRIGERPQDIIHQDHESGWGIHKTKRYDQLFKKTLFGLESNLPYISLFYGDMVVVKIQFNLTEVLASLELVKKIFDLGNWVSILDCDFI